MKMKLSLRGMVFSALFAALLVVSSFLNIHLGFTPVPISMQNLAVMLAGAVLGPLYGFFSMALVVVLTAIGIPLLHGSGGLALILGPTGGFIWAYPFAALLIGWAAKRIKGQGPLAFVSLFIVLELFGSLLLYVSGVPWLAHVANYSLQKALAQGCYPYLPGDAVKAVVAALIVIPVRKVFPIARITGTNDTKAA
ncbi:biotin transporter BioY [Paenibacillus radicis (ex Xue et al. 2023)]|uniref:Biotin transporter n=1 Tax=Paenibacillus radicis (ex Xue et al. 2023) TaxID=2972489 RepID=A0ABT1YRR8_9BACL|nr:biotin transporter BioY [Paenibacillus radicis (ex Xue et al. 2023)]MCR8635069.1 biotin transporter BioY [Paenibacillus radicis (ex Xue et al. 2023)]